MIARISLYLSHIFILFTSLSLIALLYANIFLPSTTSLSRLSSSMDDNHSLLRYKVSYLYSNSRTSFLYNYGDEVVKIEKIYLDPIGYYDSNIYIYYDNRWVESKSIPPHTVFKLSIGLSKISGIDSLILFTDKGVVRVYV